MNLDDISVSALTSLEDQREIWLTKFNKKIYILI